MGNLKLPEKYFHLISFSSLQIATKTIKPERNLGKQPDLGKVSEPQKRG